MLDTRPLKMPNMSLIMRSKWIAIWSDCQRRGFCFFRKNRGFVPHQKLGFSEVSVNTKPQKTPKFLTLVPVRFFELPRHQRFSNCCLSINCFISRSIPVDSTPCNSICRKSSIASSSLSIEITYCS